MISTQRVLTTERCVLRYPELGDAPRLLALVTHPAFPVDLPFAQLRSVEAVEGALRRRQERWQAGEGYNWCIDDRSSKALIGMAGIGRGTPVNCWDLSFMIAPARWRQGFATEASRELLALAFDELGAVVVEAGAAIWNAGSQASLTKLGFSFIAENAEGYSIHGRPIRTREYELGVEAWRSEE